MPKKLDPKLIEILTHYGEDVERAIWDCHGTWVVYHAAIERIAARANVVFDMPVVIEASTAQKVVSIIVAGTMGDKREWSFGEASPANCKNSYVYAMAEKRAKDRVVLKLVGLHGLAYSEEESYDFKGEPSAPQKPTRHALKKDIGNVTKPDRFDEFLRDVADCNSISMLNKCALEWSAVADAQGWADGELGWRTVAKEEINKRREVLLNGLPDDDTFPGDIPSRRELSQHPINAG